jgi:V8-like Glu-specific endopeptidase
MAQVNQVKVIGYFLDRGAAVQDFFSTKKVRHQQREFYRISKDFIRILWDFIGFNGI